MVKEAEGEKKERKVSRFGREREEGDEPVEYRPIVRKGGRKIGSADGVKLRVPVRSSISRPTDTARPPRRVGKEELDGLRHTQAAAVPEEESKKNPVDLDAAGRQEIFGTFDINSLMDMLGPAKTDTVKTALPDPGDDIPADNWETVSSGESTGSVGVKVDLDTERDLELPVNNAVIYEESEFREEEPEIPRTPFEKRKAALACGVPAKFFCAMNNAGYLEGKITKESASRAVRLFMASRLVDKVNSGDVSPDEMNRVSEEIERLRRGMTAVISEKDIVPELTSEDIFRKILGKIRYGKQ